MDYGFGPGTTGQDTRFRRLISRRANTSLIHKSSVKDVRAFINHLNTTAGINKPIGDMLIGSHANNSGQMQIRMWNGQRGRTTYETLEKTITDVNRSIEIPDDLIGFHTGDQVTHNFDIKGCNVGKAEPFLEKFQEALGKHVNITAPIHFHGLTYSSSYGIFEWMAYEFMILRKDAFANRAAAVAGFQAAAQANSSDYDFYEGTAVEQNFWNTRQFKLPQANPPVEFKWQKNWIPNRINRSVSYNINAPLDPPIGSKKTVGVVQQFRVKKETFRWTVKYPNASAVPGDAATRKQAVKTSISNDARYSDTHDFPVYERWGYDDFDSFFSGFTWTINKNKRYLVAAGTRYRYTILLPIVNLSTGNLIHNFYPNTGSTHAARLTGLETTNAQFFKRL